jgi:hypothetical protein
VYANKTTREEFKRIKIKLRGAAIKILLIKKSFTKKPEKGGNPARFNKFIAEKILSAAGSFKKEEIFCVLQALNPHSAIKSKPP